METVVVVASAQFDLKAAVPTHVGANRVRDCLPVPPTPTSRALPPPWRIIREILEDRQKEFSICSLQNKQTWRLKELKSVINASSFLNAVSLSKMFCK